MLGLKGSGKPLLLTGNTLRTAADLEGKGSGESSPKWPDNHWLHREREEQTKKYADMDVRVCHVRIAPYIYGRNGSGVELFMGMWSQAGAGVKFDRGHQAHGSCAC